MAEENQTAQPGTQRPNIKMVANPLPPEEIFVDGFTGILTRRGVVKLECYRVLRVDTKENTETRTVTHRLVIPAGSLPALASLIRQIVDAGREKAGVPDGADAQPQDQE